MLCRSRRVHAEYELNGFNSNLPKRWAPFCVQVGLLDLGGFKGLELLVIKCWTSRHVRRGLKIVQKKTFDDPYSVEKSCACQWQLVLREGKSMTTSQVVETSVTVNNKSAVLFRATFTRTIILNLLISYFAWSAKAIMPEAIAAVPEVPGNLSVQSDAPFAVICI